MSCPIAALPSLRQAAELAEQRVCVVFDLVQWRIQK